MSWPSLSCLQPCAYNKCMNDFQFYVNSISVISGQCESDNEAMCNGTSFTVEMILLRAGISRPALNPLSYRGPCAYNKKLHYMYMIP